jgi:hypothetical protein
MTQLCRRAKSPTTSTICASKLPHHCNQMLPLLRLLVLLNKQVNHTYRHYKVENRLDSSPNNHEPCIHDMVYFACIGQTWKPK